jgi:hypothetical protein
MATVETLDDIQQTIARTMGKLRTMRHELVRLEDELDRAMTACSDVLSETRQSEGGAP